MWKLRMCVAAAAGAFALGTGAAAWGASGGDSNKGDVWLDNVGQPPGPGHEMDPHLACQDINLWGSGMAESTGNYTIAGWPPSGSKEQVYPTTGPGTWNYDTSQGGSCCDAY